MISSRGLALKEVIPLNRVQKIMAKSMKASLDSLALSQLSRELDVSELYRIQQRMAFEGRKISFNTLMMAAVATILPNHPLINAEMVENEILVYEQVNLGMAVATDAGLVVVVIPDANKLNIDDLSTAIADRAERARAGKLGLKDIEGGTFTVSNLGMYGVDCGVPIPRPPESAILLLGAATPKPAVMDDRVVIRDQCWASLSYDHRFIDGVTAARFLQDFYNILISPEVLVKQP